jgi:hypothetical protein
MAPPSRAVYSSSIDPPEIVMEGITSAIAAQQSNLQSEMALLAMQMAARQQRQIAELLAQAVQQSVLNPAHLGQNIDTYA